MEREGRPGSYASELSVFTYRVSAIGLSDDIGGEGADGADGKIVSRQGGEAGHLLR